MTAKTSHGDQYSKGAIKLIVTAEKLFGEQGIEGVSLRQIVTAAGLVNSYSIQHHFGSKEGLVQAVYDWRVPAFDEACRARLEKLGDSTVLRELLAARFMPLLEAFDARAQKRYTMFLLRLLYRSDKEHPHFRSKIPQSASQEVNQRLSALFDTVPEEVFNTRYRLASDFFLGAMIEKRRLSAIKKSLYSDESYYWDEVLQIMESIFTVPYGGG